MGWILTEFDIRMDVLLTTSRLNARMSTAFEACTGSSVARFTILYALSTAPSMLQTEIRSLLGLDASAVTRHLQLLEDSGFLTRQRVSGDQRSVQISITDAGRERITVCADKRESFLTALFEGVDVNHLDVLLNALSIVESNLDAAASICAQKDNSAADVKEYHDRGDRR